MDNFTQQILLSGSREAVLKKSKNTKTTIFLPKNNFHKISDFADKPLAQALLQKILLCASVEVWFFEKKFKLKF